MQPSVCRFSSKLAISPLVTMLVAAPAWADCSTRHFYNNSLTTFSVYLETGACSIGASGMQRACNVPSGQVAELHYANNLANDRIQISSSGPPYAQGGSFFVRGWLAGRCYIEHNGNTGNIVVNSDADGDVATCGPLHPEYGSNGGYTCQ
jgi:hypothetical protein